MISQSKIYHKLGVFLGRRKISNSHALSKLLLEKFVYSKKNMDWKNISAADLKDFGILGKNKENTYYSWRNEMLKNSILICMANKDELKEKDPNFKASMFKAGGLISKYIDQAIKESLPSRVQNTEIKLDDIEIKIETKANLIDLQKAQEKIMASEKRIELDSPEIKTCKLKFKNEDFFGKNKIRTNSELICIFSVKPSEETFLVA